MIKSLGIENAVPSDTLLFGNVASCSRRRVDDKSHDAICEIASWLHFMRTLVTETLIARPRAVQACGGHRAMIEEEIQCVPQV